MLLEILLMENGRWLTALRQAWLTYFNSINLAEDVLHGCIDSECLFLLLLLLRLTEELRTRLLLLWHDGRLDHLLLLQLPLMLVLLLFELVVEAVEHILLVQKRVREFLLHGRLAHKLSYSIFQQLVLQELVDVWAA